MKNTAEVNHLSNRAAASTLVCSLIALFIGLAPAMLADARADDLVSLESLDGTDSKANGKQEADVALDLGADSGAQDFFNPYTFARTKSWVLLPVLSLILLGLHLLPIPKRKSKKRIDQAQRFFRGISGEKTSPGIVIDREKMDREKS